MKLGTFKFFLVNSNLIENDKMSEKLESTMCELPKKHHLLFLTIMKKIISIIQK